MNNNTNKVVLTGGISGLGNLYAKNIAKHDENYLFIIACRNQEKSANAIEKLILADAGNSSINVLDLDLGSLFSMRSSHERFSESSFPPLNAGGCNARQETIKKIIYTKDGFEKTFGVNHFGHFLLANLLLKNRLINGRIVINCGDTIDTPYFLPFFSSKYIDAILHLYPEIHLDCIDQKSYGMLRCTTSIL